MKLQPNEEKALNDASLLIKYAAESPKTLPENITMPIALAWKAREDNAWTPEVSSKFWTAYSGLCDLVKPVTLETIAASAPVNAIPKPTRNGGCCWAPAPPAASRTATASSHAFCICA